MAKQKAKREAFVVENSEGPVKASLSNEWATALAATVRGRVVRYVPESDAQASGWDAWAIVSARGAFAEAHPSRKLAGFAAGEGENVIKVRVVPVEPVKRAKAKATKRGGAR